MGKQHKMNRSPSLCPSATTTTTLADRGREVQVAGTHAWDDDNNCWIPLHIHIDTNLGLQGTGSNRSKNQQHKETRNLISSSPLICIYLHVPMN